MTNIYKVVWGMREYDVEVEGNDCRYRVSASSDEWTPWFNMNGLSGIDPSFLTKVKAAMVLWEHLQQQEKEKLNKISDKKNRYRDLLDV